jgi:hypothetical protein
MRKPTIAIVLLAAFGLCAQGRLRVDRADGICYAAASGDEVTSGICYEATTHSSAKYSGWIAVDQQQKVSLELTFTDANDSVTALTTTCQTSDSRTTADGSGFELCSVAVSAGTGTRTCPYTETLTTGTAEKFTQTWTNLPHAFINCQYTATGTPAAADTLLLSPKTRNY